MATPTSSRRYSRFQPQTSSSASGSSAEELVEALQPTVSASVGHDHWANDVLKAVDKSSGSNSPESCSSTGGLNDSADTLEVIKSKVLEKKRKFHTGRCLELKNLPDGCVEQDIREAFADLGIVSVTIERNDGRYKASAKLTLEYPELLDEWPESRQNIFVRNKEVSVCVGNSDGWLCVAKLPLSYSDEEFFNLASAYGKVREAFLMISERTGDSKGYGLIKYVSSEAAAQARHLLDGRTVTGGHRDNPTDVYKLDCDWLNSSHISFGSLHSKALYVDHLPPNFRDMTEFRKLFSSVKAPPYCQIAMPKGVIQDWGLVEFFNPMDSEDTQRVTNLTLFHGRRIRVHFCIPGVNAINIYMQAVNAPPDTKKKALLQDTPTASVYSQLQKLTAQNPAFAQNLQNIIQEQIQTLSSGTAALLPSSSASTPAAAAVVSVSSASSTSVTNVSSSIVNRPPAAVATTTAYGTQQPPQQSSSLSSNAQAALMILLTAQMQSQSGEPSVLQNPQVVSILQTLVNNAADTSTTASAQGNKAAPQTTAVDMNELLKDPSLAAVFRSNTTQRPALLDTPKTRPILLTNPMPANANEDLMPGNNLDNLLNTQNLNQLLGSLNNAAVNEAVAKQPATQPQPQPTQPQQPVNQQSLLPTPNSVTSSTGYYPRTAVIIDAASQSLMGFPTSYQPVSSASNPFILQQQPQQQLYVQQPQPQQILGFQGYPTLTPYLGQNMALMTQQAPPVSSYQAQPQVYSQNGYHFASPPPSQPSAAVLHATGGGSTTPLQAGMKRRLNIPPSPEQSPEGSYVGQHSQGLGGHYASSYLTKKAKKY